MLWDWSVDASCRRCPFEQRDSIDAYRPAVLEGPPRDRPVSSPAMLMAFVRSLDRRGSNTIVLDRRESGLDLMRNG
jgi:hypothetical protein